MTENNNKNYDTEAQTKYMNEQFAELGNVYSNPKALDIWDSPTGESDPKTTFAATVLAGLTCQVAGGALLVWYANANEDFAKDFGNMQWLAAGLTLALGFGALLYFKKDIRQNGAVAFWLFVAHCVGVAILLAAVKTTFMDNHLGNMGYFSATVACLCMWEGARRTKSFNTLNKHMVVSTFMAILIVTLVVVFKEH